MSFYFCVNLNASGLSVTLLLVNLNFSPEGQWRLLHSLLFYSKFWEVTWNVLSKQVTLQASKSWRWGVRQTWVKGKKYIQVRLPRFPHMHVSTATVKSVFVGFSNRWSGSYQVSRFLEFSNTIYYRFFCLSHYIAQKLDNTFIIYSTGALFWHDSVKK